MSDTISREAAVIPPEVKLALRVLLNHVEPGWDNCKTVVQLWLDAVPCVCATCGLPIEPRPDLGENEECICPDGDECPDAQFHAPAPQAWTEEGLARAIGAEFMRTASVPTVLSASVGRLAARVALSRPLAKVDVEDVRLLLDIVDPDSDPVDPDVVNRLRTRILAAIGEGKP